MTSLSKKQFLLMVMAGLFLLLPGAPLSARTVWKTGTITKAPWVDRHQRMEVDKEPYLFMPKDVRMTRHYQDSSGAWQEEPISLQELHKGQKVWMRIQGHRIYELFIEE